VWVCPECEQAWAARSQARLEAMPPLPDDPGEALAVLFNYLATVS
jgi:hypothetical protein